MRENLGKGHCYSAPIVLSHVFDFIPNWNALPLHSSPKSKQCMEFLIILSKSSIALILAAKDSIGHCSYAGMTVAQGSLEDPDHGIQNNLTLSLATSRHIKVTHHTKWMKLDNNASKN